MIGGIKSKSKMPIRQLFDTASSTYTYLVWCSESMDGILIDPVDVQVDRDLKVVSEEGVNLLYGVNTHAHADHITGTGILKTKVKGLRSIISKASTAKADIHYFFGPLAVAERAIVRCDFSNFPCVPDI